MVATVNAASVTSASLRQYRQDFLQDNGWTQKGSITFNAARTQIVSGNGSYVSLRGSTAAQVDQSTDGATWTARSIGSSVLWNAAAYGSGTFVIAGAASTAYSTNGGVGWSAGGALPVNNAGWILAYGNGIFMAMNSISGAVATATPSQAASNTAWTSTGASVAGNALAYGAGMWVALVSGSSTYYTSTNNGSSWTTRTRPDIGTLPATSPLVYANGRFMYIQTGSNSIYTSTDGINWNLSTSTIAANSSSLAFGSDRWMIVSSAGTTASSSYSTDNGATWTALTTPSASVWTGLTYSTAGFVAVSSTSPGIVIQLIPPTIWTAPTGVTTVECFLVAGGGAGGAHSSFAGGGGGGGQVLLRQLVVVPGTAYAVTIGTGGLGAATALGTNGMNSSFGTLLTALGGGAGGSASDGVAGGSGGGGAAQSSTLAGAGGGGGAGGPGGNAVYNGSALSSTYRNGGLGQGGSSGGLGAATNSIGGAGGPGINGFGGGGGGGGSSSLVGAGSSGGGRGSSGTATAGAANTGGGGGGAGPSGTFTGGGGGSGYCQLTWWA